MKKITLLLISLLFTTNVYAIEDRECTSDEIIAGKSAINDITFDLSYNSDVITERGDKRNGFFDISFPNLPTGYVVSISANENSSVELYSPTETVPVRGGAYNLSFYNNNCSTVIKSYEIFIPSYKSACDLQDGCKVDEEELWTDPIDNNVKEQKKESKKSMLITILFIVLGVLIVITIILVIAFIKRRRSHEKNI